MVINDHNHFAFLIVLQNVMGAIDFRMLIHQTVTGVVPNKFDRDIQLIFPLNPITGGGHFRSTLNGIGPQEHRDTGFDWVFKGRHTDKRQAVGAFTSTGVTAINTDITGQDCQHGNGSAGVFAVGMTLWPPTLGNISRLH